MLWLVLMACGQAGTDGVAAVMLVDGEAWIERDGQRTDAVVGTMLERDDVLRTGASGSILVHLRNDHVVRVDSDLALPVGDIFMLDASKAVIPPGQQLAELIYPDEQARLGEALHRAERVAGWHARLTAAVAPSGAAPAMRMRPPAAEAAAEERSGSAAPTDAADVERGPGSRAVIAPARPLDDGLLEDKKSAEPPPPPPTPPPPAAPDAGADQALPAPMGGIGEVVDAVPQTTLTALNARFAKKGDLRSCVVTWADTLPKRPKSLPIRLVVRDGVIERAVVERGGLRLPACARDALEGVGVDAADGAKLTLDL